MSTGTRNLILFLTSLLLAGVFFVSCDKAAGDSPSVPGKVFLRLQGVSGTRTHINTDGLSVSWDESDDIAVWALSSSGKYVLDGTVFRMYGLGDGEAVFTADLPESMPEDTYKYMVCSPSPASVRGTEARFLLPSRQDGRADDGSLIMVSDPVTHSELHPSADAGNGSSLSVRMHHLLHLLKFYLPSSSDALKGEKVKKIVFTMPAAVVGTVVKDMASPGSPATLSEGSASVTLELADPLDVSEADFRNYACAAVFPSSYEEGKMLVKLYSENYVGKTGDIVLDGRTFAAGHATPVALRVEEILPVYSLHFRLAADNAGEPVTRITLSSSKPLSDDGSRSLVFESASGFAIGGTVSASFSNPASFLAMSGEVVTVKLETEHVESERSVIIGNLRDVTSYTSDIEMPYLLFEDFSLVGNNSWDDDYGVSSTGSRNGHSFLDGWSAARAGTSAGKSVRIAARREVGMYIEALYPARMDSAPLCRIKSPVEVEVSFNYSYSNQYLNDDSNLGQDVSVGYVTSTGAFKSDAEDGTFVSSISIPAGGNGSYDSVGESYSFNVLIPAGSSNRISWKSQVKSKRQFAGNTTCWFYIDNVKVQVAN
ncbi:MAG: hypothetical protein MJY42_00915 [Bacteroidales bacterium]|nr:hypothetical protein [Bacteroidales bacterium]